MDFPGEKLVIRLWETLAEKGVGSLLSPWHAKREGRARNEIRRHELLILAQAELDAAEVRAGRARVLPNGDMVRLTGPGPAVPTEPPPIIESVAPPPGLPAAMAAASTTGAAEAARREINSSKAILFAEDQLATDTQEPSKRQIEDDWLFAWREYSGRVSNEDLQRLWGSILAGEIKSPGAHSMRSLDFLRGLSKSEAELLTKLAGFVVDGTVVRSQSKYLEASGLPFGTLLHLQELGVISGVESIGLSIKHTTVAPGRFLKPLISHNRVLIVEDPTEGKVLELSVYRLTDVGRQVLRLGSFVPDLAYLKAVGGEIAAKGFQVRIAEWKQDTEEQGRFFNASPIDA